VLQALPFSVHHTPWLLEAAAEDSSPNAGRSFLVLETAHDPSARVRILDSAHGLARLGPTGEGNRELWELPTVWTPTTRSAAPHLNLEVVTRGQRSELTVSVPPPPEAGFATNGEEPEDLPDAARSFEKLLDHHVEASRHWLDGGEEESADLIRRASGLTIVPLHEFCERYWDLEKRKDAPLTLIVRIANEVAPIIDELASSPRRILRRERQLVPLGRAQQVDASCIRWLTRQPGRTMAQRAGPRQVVRAVVREPSIDTLENRVLRHFLELCRAAASRYLGNHQDHAASLRFVAVRRLRTQVDRLLREAPIGTVGRLDNVPEPNYVLQFDDRYSIIWTWYIRLIRQEKEKDDLRAWHHRVWGERCRTAVLSTLERTCLPRHSFRGQLALRGEAKFGSFYHGASTSGPWSFRRATNQHVLRIMSRSELLAHPILSPASVTACEFALVRHDPFETNVVSALVLAFCMHTPLDDDETTVARLHELEGLLAGLPFSMPTALILFTPHQPGTRALLQTGNRIATSVRIPLPEHQDMSPGWKALDNALAGLL
jgi:hypothetical protein